MYLTDGFKKDGPGHEAITRVSLRTFFFFFFFEKHTHAHRRQRERGSNTNAHHNST